MSLCQWFLGNDPWSHQKVLTTNLGWRKWVHSSAKGNLSHKPESAVTLRRSWCFVQDGNCFVHWNVEFSCWCSWCSFTYMRCWDFSRASPTFSIWVRQTLWENPKHEILTMLQTKFVLPFPSSAAITMQAAHAFSKTACQKAGVFSSLFNHTNCGEQGKTKNKSNQNPHFWHEESQAWRIPAVWDFFSVIYWITIT